MRWAFSSAVLAATWGDSPAIKVARSFAGGGLNVGKLDDVAAVLTCERSQRSVLLRERSLANARAGFAYDEDLSSLAEDLWSLWREYAASPVVPLAPGALATARALIGEEPAIEDYCFPAHVTAGFLTARSMHWAYAVAVSRPGDTDVEVPWEVLEQTQALLLGVVMLFGHNRLLDVGRVAGWAVGAAEMLETRAALLRACSEDGLEEPCTVGRVESELGKSLAQLSVPLIADPGSLGGAPLWRPGQTRDPRVGSCRARALTGASPCSVRVWYLGTHEALFQEVETMWKHLSEDFHFDFFRLNQQGIYKPGEMPAESVGSQDPAFGLQGRTHAWDAKKSLSFRFVGEAILDIQPAAARLRWLLQRRGEEAGGHKFDATLLLCTIPAFACSAFAEMELPVVMYAANPATAQVPPAQRGAWLALLAALAAESKNQLVVSNPWSQAQFEYQMGAFLPMIRVHGLYTAALHSAGRESNHSSEVLVYDRTSPLMSCVLEAILSTTGTVVRSSAFPAHFVHHASTNREYGTFASFSAAVFVPGDVEQMAFYELYSMGLPLFVPADPGRYIWPQLGPSQAEDAASCGAYGEWGGTWELRYSDGTFESLSINCSGHAELESGEAGRLWPLARMDARGFSHCLEVSAGHRQRGQPLVRRLRLTQEQLQVVILSGEDACTRSLAATAPGQQPVADGTRRSGEPAPPQPSLWDHDIFASVAWFLEAKLGGPRRTMHSPFNLDSLAAAREWAAVMDYFRFPAVGRFVSAAELISVLAAQGRGGLAAVSREMRTFNDHELRRSLRQWHVVLSEVVL